MNLSNAVRSRTVTRSLHICVAPHASYQTCAQLVEVNICNRPNLSTLTLRVGRRGARRWIALAKEIKIVQKYFYSWKFNSVVLEESSVESGPLPQFLSRSRALARVFRPPYSPGPNTRFISARPRFLLFSPVLYHTGLTRALHARKRELRTRRVSEVT